MAQRGGRRGGDAPLAKKLLAFLQRECGDGAGGSEPRGRGSEGRGTRSSSAASDGRGRRGGGRASQHRDGDWKCRQCNFQPNFGFRQRCWKCGRPRGDSQPASSGNPGGRAAGPIGASGSRPLLGGGTGRASAASREDGPPTFRRPGSSLAAKAAEARSAAPAPSPPAQAGPRRQGPGATSPSGAAPPRGSKEVGEEDGFQLVQRRKGKSSGGGKRDPVGTQEADDDGMDLDGATAHAGDDDDDIDGAEDDVTEDAPGPSELRQLWQQEVGMVKQMARQGISPEHPAMVAAIAARDDAERKWRGAKTPAPLATRLGWAQRKLDRAISIQADTRQEMQALERQYKASMAELQERLAEDSERVSKRRQQLESVQLEAGGGAPKQRMQGSQGEAVRRACNTLRQDVAPALVALAEQLGTGTDAWSSVNSILAKLSASQLVMDEAAEATTQRFDMANDDDSFWSESHDLQPGCDDHCDHADGGGGMHPQPTGQSWQPVHQQHQQDLQRPGRSDAEHNAGGGGAHSWDNWRHSDWTAAPKWREQGHGQWTRASWADAWESEQRGDEEMEEQSEPQCKHRRQGGAAYDEVEKPPSAGAGSPPPTGQAGQASPQGQGGDAARQHSEMLSRIVEAAIGAGVQPLTHAGEELHVLDAQQLAAWAAENLPPN